MLHISCSTEAQLSTPVPTNGSLCKLVSLFGRPVGSARFLVVDQHFLTYTWDDVGTFLSNTCEYLMPRRSLIPCLITCHASLTPACLQRLSATPACRAGLPPRVLRSSDLTLRWDRTLFEATISPYDRRLLASYILSSVPSQIWSFWLLDGLTEIRAFPSSVLHRLDPRRFCMMSFYRFVPGIHFARTLAIACSSYFTSFCSANVPSHGSFRSKVTLFVLWIRLLFMLLSFLHSEDIQALNASQQNNPKLVTFFF